MVALHVSRPQLPPHQRQPEIPPRNMPHVRPDFSENSDDRGQRKFAVVSFNLGSALFQILEIQSHRVPIRILFEHLSSVGTDGHIDVKPFSCIQEIADAV